MVSLFISQLLNYCTMYITVIATVVTVLDSTAAVISSLQGTQRKAKGARTHAGHAILKPSKQDMAQNVYTQILQYEVDIWHWRSVWDYHINGGIK